MASRVPFPFHGSANLERFPPTSEGVSGEPIAGERDSKQQRSMESWMNSSVIAET